MITQFPVLESNRLILREFTQKDVDLIYELRKSERIAEHIIRQLMQDKSSAEVLFEQIIDGYNSGKAISWVGELKSSGEVIGSCGLMNFNEPRTQAEIGGEMLITGWGKGYALEAVIRILDYSFRSAGLDLIYAHVLASNKSAKHVLKRLGFKRDLTFENKIDSIGRTGYLHKYELSAPAHRKES